MINYKIQIILSKLRGYLYNFIIKSTNLVIGSNFSVSKVSNLIIESDVTIGSNVKLISNGIVRLKKNANIGNYCTIRCYPQDSFFKVGTNFTCGDFCFFGAAGGIYIGNDVLMGQNIRIHAQNHIFDDITTPIRNQGTTQQGVTIGNDCWIGSGVVILDGVSIGDGCIIGANSTVSKDIEPYSVAVGSPCRVIKSR